MASSLWRFFKGIILRGEATDLTDNISGSLWFNSTDKEFKGYADDGVRTVVTEDQSQTLSNKTHSDSTTFIVDDIDATKRVNIDAAGTTGTTTTIVSSQTVNRTLTLPDATDTLVGKATTDVLTNKSIDADTNTISNLEVDNLKAGVLDTDISTVSVADDTLPSAKAVKTYVDTHINNTTDAHDASAISFSPVGTIAATDAQTAIAEVATDAATALSTHESDTTTHGTTGNIVGTSDAQTLTNKELVDASTTIVDSVDATKKLAFDAAGTTGTTTTITSSQTVNRTITLPDATTTMVGTDTAQTLTNKTVVAANNTITTAASGNLIATELNAALAELQTDIDTRATSTALNDHLADTADAHDASAISTTAITGVAGGLASDVQTVVADLKTQIDTKASTTQLSDHEADTTGIHGIADTSLLVTTTGTQVLTAKDIDGGTASNTSRITIPKDTYANLLLLTRKAGTIVYATDTGTVYYDNGTSLEEVGSGGGTTNFIEGGDAETGLIGTAIGTGALSLNTTTQLSGIQSFIYTPSATIGDGWSFTFTIERQHLAKQLQIEFPYEIASGTYTDDDLYFEILAPSGATIQPVNHEIKNLGSGINSKHIATFQTESTGTSYTLRLKQATATTGYTVKFEVAVSPIVTPIQNTNVAFAAVRGTAQTVAADTTAQITFANERFDKGGDNFSTSTSKFTAPYPGEYIFTSNIYFTTGATVPSEVDAFFRLDGAGNYGAWVATDLIANKGYSASISTSLSLRAGQTVEVAMYSGAQPITVSAASVGGEWGLFTGTCTSSTAGSLATDSGRVVALQAHRNGTNQTGFNPNISYAQVQINSVASAAGGGKDTHGAFNTSSYRYVAPEPGQYDFKAAVLFAATNVLAVVHQLGFYVNGTLKVVGPRFVATAGQSFALGANAQITLNAGDYVELFCYGGGDNSTNKLTIDGDSRVTYLHANKISSGNQAITAAEKIAARYTTNVAHSVATSAAVSENLDFEDKVYDSHGAVTGTGTGINGSWRFTAPRADYYRVSASTMFAATTTWAPTEIGLLSIFKNGSFYSYLVRRDDMTTNNVYMHLNGTDTVFLNAGEYIEIRIYQTSGAALSLHPDGNYNIVSIESAGG